MNTPDIKGTVVSEGLASAIGKYVSYESAKICLTKCKDTSAELLRFEEARNCSRKQIEAIFGNKSSQLGDDERKIFEAHLMMLDDPDYIEQIRSLIAQDFADATLAVDTVSKSFAEIFAALPDPYLAARGSDILDIGMRFIRNLTGSDQNLLGFQEVGFILLCRDIPPSAVAELDPHIVKAVIAENGGFTSHAAILLKNLEIPAIFGTTGTNLTALDGHYLLVDAKIGVIHSDPSGEELGEFQRKIEELQSQEAELAKLVNQAAITHDGQRVQLLANVGSQKEIPVLKKFNPDGIGLFRTEFLFLHRRSAPTENEQTEIYKSMLEAMGDRKTTIRTLDIGGDKDVPYLKIPKEENPFLGLRGLRYCLHNQDVFRLQLRALLRASPFGNLQIMYPMVTTLSELDAANKILAEESARLSAAGINYSKNIKVGIMIEVPAAAIMADSFARRVDFMSLGTNDLIQYTCACDRLNPTVKGLYNPYEPAVLKLINIVAQAAKKHKIELSVCGEMAGNPQLASFFLGIGILNLSMGPPLIPRLKRKISGIDMTACAELAQQALACNSAEETALLFSK